MNRIVLTLFLSTVSLASGLDADWFVGVRIYFFTSHSFSHSLHTRDFYTGMETDRSSIFTVCGSELDVSMSVVGKQSSRCNANQRMSV